MLAMKKLIALLLTIGISGCSVNQMVESIQDSQNRSHVYNYEREKRDYLEMVNQGKLAIALVRTQKTKMMWVSSVPRQYPVHRYYFGNQTNILDSIIEAYAKCKLQIGVEDGCQLEMVGKYKSLESEKIFFNEFLTAIIDEYFQINIIYPVRYADMDLTKTYPNIDMSNIKFAIRRNDKPFTPKLEKQLTPYL